MNIKNMAMAAKRASFEIAKSSLMQRNAALAFLVQNLTKHQEAILAANQKDIDIAKADGLAEALLERLSLKGRLEGIIDDILQVIGLPDPIGVLFDESTHTNQLRLAKCSIPMGVIGVIYESRPNVTLDISALIIKSGNCAILRGGSETLHTNRLLVEIIQDSLKEAGLPSELIQLIAHADRAAVHELLQLHEVIDLIIPRGGPALQQYCREHSAIPVITGGVGICHLFVDESADVERSYEVIVNAKMQRPTVCNALDTLLVHAEIAPSFIPLVVKRLGEQGVTFRVDPKICEGPTCRVAQESDWDTEWLSLVLGIKVVKNVEEAIEHIQVHGGHSDGILTESPANADRFVREINSAAVFVNASTRFTDGGQFGLGAEVAVSTQKLHARGPMGLKELTSYKWIARGDYLVRS